MHLANQRNAKGLVDIFRKESNIDLKKDILQRLQNMHTAEANELFLEILKMTRTLCLLLAALSLAAAQPLAAQPKLLVNANLDTRSAGAGLEAAFKPLRPLRHSPRGSDGRLLPSAAIT